MTQTIKRYLIILSSALALLAPVGMTAVASAGPSAACTGVSGGLQEGANAATNSGTPVAGGIGGAAGSGQAVGCADTNVDNSAIKTLAAKITNTFSIIVGAASIIMIIYGGFRYVTSGGESGRVGAAKNALLYAIVGLVIVALAQLIVHFVLNQASNLGS